MTSSSTTRFRQAIRIVFVPGFFVLFAALFPLQASALQQPAMYTPSCNSAGTQVTLSWGSVSGASNYPIRVDGPGYCAGNVSGPGNWGCYQGVEYLYETAYSGIALSITPSTSYSWWVHAQNGGVWSPATQQSFSCGPPPPPSPPASCSLTLDKNAVNSSPGSGTYLRWSTSNANSWVYISPIGYVGTSGSTYVAPSSSTTYSCEAYGSGGTDGWHNATLTVYPPPPEPTGQTYTCSADGTSVTFSWNAVNTPSLVGYPLRLDDTTADGCSIAPYYHSWYCNAPNELEIDWQAPYQNQTITATSYTAPIVPGRSYRWWVHSLASPDGSVNYAWSTTTAHPFSCSPPTEPANTSAGNYSCSADGTQATISWGPSTGATSYALRVDDTAVNCGGVSGPNNNGGCRQQWWTPSASTGWTGSPGYTDYIDDNIPIGTNSRTITVTPGAPTTWWVHGVAGPTPYGSYTYNYNTYATYTYSTYTYRTFTCTASAPTCSVTLSPTSIISGGTGSTLTYSSANASRFYIQTVGDVTPNVSRSPTVYTAGSYNGTVWDASGNTYSCSPQGGTLTVYQNCTFNGSTVGHGSSVTAYEASTVPYGQACLSQTRTCTNGTLSGSYAYASCSVRGPSSCTLDGVTVPHNSSYTFYSQRAAPSGTVCSSISQSRRCVNGTLSGSSAYQYASCSCLDTYTCSAQTVRHTNAQCEVTSGPTCVSPSFCSNGSSVCQYPPTTFNRSGLFTGHLFATPSLVLEGDRTTLYWDVANVSSCTVTPSDGAAWTIAGTSGNNWTSTPGPDGQTSAAITQRTTFTLTCTGVDGSPTTPEDVTVNISPEFRER